MISLSDSYYQLFGLPVAFDLSVPQLQEKFLALQSAVHPDKFTDRSDAEKRLAMQWATHVNEAFSTLKDAVKRAAYWCEQQGQPVNAEYNTAMSPAFLMQQMERREALAEAEHADALGELEQEVKSCRKATLKALAHAIDVEHNPVKASELTRQMMFIDKFRYELDAALERFNA